MVKQIIATAMAVFVFDRCDNEIPKSSNAKPHFQQTFRHESQQCYEKNISSANFVVPDSVDKSLLVVCFIEELPQNGYSIIVYEDTTKTTATKTKYCDDGKILKDKLTAVDPNYFKSNDQRGEYFIKERTVLYSYQQGSCNVSFEHKRDERYMTDNILWKLPLPVVPQKEQ